jgi:hypothetical protein
MRLGERSPYRFLVHDSVPFLLPSQHHPTARPSPDRYENRYEREVPSNLTQGLVGS